MGGQRRSKGMRQHAGLAQVRSPKARTPKSGGITSGAGWIYGTHAAKAALANPKRTIHKILLQEGQDFSADITDHNVPPITVPKEVLTREFGTAHQGIAVRCAPLEWPDITDIIESAPEDGIILVLDQITDPHNVGAMFRLASAFGIGALVMQTRHAPPLSGATAKVAVGCVETVPVCLVTNIANTLRTFQDANWMVTGLAGETELDLSKAVSGGGQQVIVMGAEGPGLRPRVRDHCDQLARIPMRSSNILGEAESLNVATAAAIALYEARRGF